MNGSQSEIRGRPNTSTTIQWGRFNPAGHLASPTPRFDPIWGINSTRFRPLGAAVRLTLIRQGVTTLDIRLLGEVEATSGEATEVDLSAIMSIRGRSTKNTTSINKEEAGGHP